MNFALRVLILLHFVIGIVLGLWTFRQVANQGQFIAAAYLYIGIVSGQAGLFGIWLALGSHPFWIRAITVIGATAYLIFNLKTCIQEPDSSIAILLILVVLLTAVSLYLLRFLGYKMSARIGAEESTFGFQFSIRHLMTATLVVGVALALARQLHVDWPPIAPLIILVVFAIPFAVASVVAVGALLAGERPWAGSVGITVIAIGTGGMAAQFNDRELKMWAGATFVAALVLIVSLAVVRRQGIRWVRMKTSES